MRTRKSRRRRAWVRWALGCGAWALASTASQGHAAEPFIYNGEPVHPACLHALVMHRPDAVPVTTAVSLAGCDASERSKIPVRREEGFLVIADEALLEGGSFGYRELSQLENGIYGLAVRRVLPSGEERVSLAAINVVERAMFRSGMVIHVTMLELLAEIWVPDVELRSFRAVGNVVHFVSGVGPGRVERTADFTRLGKERR